MAGTAPTDFQFTRTLDAGPVHCSVWLSLAVRPFRFDWETSWFLLRAPFDRATDVNHNECGQAQE